MNKLIGVLLRIAIAIIVLSAICRFLGFTWADVDHFFENGIVRGVEFLKLFEGIAK